MKFLFAFECLVKTEIIVPLFQCVEADVLVVGVKRLLFGVVMLSHLGIDVPAGDLLGQGGGEAHGCLWQFLHF